MTLVLRAFQDPGAPAWLVWTTMLLCLVCLHSLLVWTVLAIIVLCQERRSALQARCGGTVLWGCLLILCIFTIALAAVLYRVLVDAQSGARLPGSDWSRHRKRRVLAGAAVTWAGLWITAGASALSGCARDKLGTNSVRRMVLVWFWCQTAILLAALGSAAGQAATLWWRRREVRMARAAYCSTQVGVETSGAGEKVII